VSRAQPSDEGWLFVIKDESRHRPLNNRGLFEINLNTGEHRYKKMAEKRQYLLEGEEGDAEVKKSPDKLDGKFALLAPARTIRTTRIVPFQMK